MRQKNINDLGIDCESVMSIKKTKVELIMNNNKVFFYTQLDLDSFLTIWDKHIFKVRIPIYPLGYADINKKQVKSLLLYDAGISDNKINGENYDKDIFC